MFDVFKEELDWAHFNCIEQYNAKIMQIAADLEEEIGRVERMLLKPTPELLNDLNVCVKGINDGEEDEDEDN